MYAIATVYNGISIIMYGAVYSSGRGGRESIA